jgi:hypothetical protein
MVITPVEFTGSYRTGQFVHITKEQLVKAIGFPPNATDDPDKVVNSWSFTIDDKPCAVWDYKGSHMFNVWSFYDPHNVIHQLFVQRG